jgi:hypothetical protein
MTIFDLLFIVLFLIGTGVFIAAAVTMLRGRWRRGAVMLAWLGACTAAYLGIVILVSVGTPQRYVPIGTAQCSDDWCIAVAAVVRTPGAAGDTYDVTFRLSSRALRVTQRERGVVTFLRDSAGRRHDADPVVSGVPFDVSLAPGQGATTTRHYALPAGVGGLALVITREGPTPACCVIGADRSLYHKLPIVRIQ